MHPPSLRFHPSAMQRSVRRVAPSTAFCSISAPLSLSAPVASPAIHAARHQPPVMSKKKRRPRSNARSNAPSNPPPNPPSDPPSTSAPPSTSSSSTPEKMLLEDLQRLRAKRAQETPRASDSSVIGTIKSAVDTLLLVDFFLVLALLGWLAVALVPHFLRKNDVLLDPWLALWQPFIQPVLGVLMMGTIAQGTLSYLRSRE
eukprot:GFKZ01004745.1.p1 GENE.GFKZ01004745.1~~GFKZ01004745.1.p1  ORF type:complete len:234 (-),score=20.02 GFKZ01004745.1:273-875(-)